MNVLGIVQARMGSSRLPGKILMDLAGAPMLVRVVLRLRRAHTLDEVMVATTTDPADDAVQALARQHDWPCYRGSQNDVLDRFVQAARPVHPETVVRITADCPLLDPEVVDRVVAAHRGGEAWDLSCNVWPVRTFPRGLDTEVIQFSALERAWREDTNPAWREHVTAFIYRRPELFRIRNVVNDQDFSRFRWTVDTSADLELVRRIYAALGSDEFSWNEVVELHRLHPEWTGINSHVEQKKVV